MIDEFGNLVEDGKSKRLLSDADVEAIAVAMADKMEDRLMQRFYLNLGRGMWDLMKKGAFVALLTLAAWGAFTGKMPK